MRGTIDGTDIYLDEGQLPAFTLSINSITDPSKVTGASSTTVKVVTTKESRRALGSEFMAEVPRQGRKTLRIGDDSTDLYKSSVIPVVHDRNGVELMSVGGNASWFEYAKGIKLPEFEFEDSPAPLGGDYIESTWTDADQLLYFPIADYGYLEGRANTFNVNYWRLRPALRAHKLIEILLEPSGYRVIPRGKLTEVWEKIVVLQPGEVLTEHFYGNPAGATAQPSGSFGYTVTDLGSTGNTYILDSEVFDPASAFASSAFTAPDVETMDVRVDGVGINMGITEPASGEYFYLHVWDNTTGLPVATIAKRYTTGDFYMRWWDTFKDVPVVAGNTYSIVIQRTVGGYSDAVDNFSNSLVTFSPADPFFTPNYFRWNEEDFTDYALELINMPVQIKTVVPDMTIAELITALVKDQCLVLVTNTDTMTIEAWYEYEYMRQPDGINQTRDWTDRIDHTIAPRVRRPESPIRILFRMAEDSGDDELYKASVLTAYPHYGNEDRTIGGYGSEQKIDLPFAATVMGTALGGLVVPVLRKKEGTYQVDDYDRKARILIADGVATGTWKFLSVTKTSYPVCYFVTPDANGHPLAWGNATAGYPGTVASFWEDRLQRMKDGRVLECYLFLKDHELQDFDHGKPTLVDDGSGPAWYYVQEIQQHRFGTHEPTKCLLVQIPGKEVDMAEPVVRALTYPTNPFVCIGPGYIPVTVDTDGGAVLISTTSGYFTLRDASDGTLITAASGDTVSDLLAGSYCAYPSDASGNFLGIITEVAAANAISEFYINGVDGYGPFIGIQLLDSSITSWNIPYVSGSPYLQIDTTPLADLTIDPGTRFNSMLVTGAALTEASVIAIINAAYASALEGVLFGSVDISGGTSAAPPSSLDAIIAALTGSGGPTVSATGLVEADGQYDPNSTINGRNAYIHSVNGVSEIFWTGSQWRILTTAGIYDSYDDVLEPWQAVTWIIVSGSGALPTIAPPGLGISVTTN